MPPTPEDIDAARAQPHPDDVKAAREFIISGGRMSGKATERILAALAAARERGAKEEREMRMNQIRTLRSEISIQQESLRKKNLELDALHYVWCTGHCKSGDTRYEGSTPLTEELVSQAEHMVKRMRERVDAAAIRARVTT